MSGDWLKFEKATLDKPEVFAIAAATGLDPDAVVGKLLRVWSWFDTHTTTGNARSVTSALLDRISGVSGFADAMREVGWLDADAAGVSLPNFDRHTGETAKNRALTAKRVAAHKEKGNAKGNAAGVTSPLPREEKRREEEKKEAAPTGADLFPDVDPKLLKDWLRIRKAKRVPLTETAAAGLRREAANAGLSAEAAIRVCCERGWAAYNAEWPNNGKPAAKEPAPLPRLRT